GRFVPLDLLSRSRRRRQRIVIVVERRGERRSSTPSPLRVALTLTSLIPSLPRYA
ncbi:hypothetical protein ALC57_07632, partial [Trachymyrmex cornetzi]